MALILQYCRYLHTPRTGGMWVNRAVENAGIVHTYIGREREHLNLRACPGQTMFSIAFVRHPWTWWRSYWVFKQMHGWADHIPVDRECRSDSFERFLRNVLESQAGYCSRVFELYVGPPRQPIAFIGRFENLVDDLIAALRLAGEKFDEEAIRTTPRTNAADYQKHPAPCSQELRDRLMASEWTALARFGYDHRMSDDAKDTAGS